MIEGAQPRDFDDTGFTAALEALLEAVPDALCVTLLDGEGETIDLATRVDPYDARIYSAEFALPLASLRRASRELHTGLALEVRLFGDLRSAVVRRVADGCDLLVVVHGSVALARAAFECIEAANVLGVEVGFSGRRSGSIPPDARPGEAPRAFLQDGKVRRIAAVLGTSNDAMHETLLVRAREGDECVIAYDTARQRWYRP